MAGDIKLNDTGVEVVGVLEVGEIAPPNRQLKVDGWDFILDCKDRRKPDSEAVGNFTVHHSSMRRALVHNVGDKLTINYGNDYPGGVEIPCQVTADSLLITKNLVAPVAKLLGYSWFGHPKAINCFAQDIILANKEKDPEEPLNNVALSHMPGDKLVINRDKGYKGGVEVQGFVTVPEKLTVQGLDLVAEIKQLKDEVKALKAKLAQYAPV